MPKHRNKKLDLNLLAKSIMEQATGQCPKEPCEEEKDQAAISGRLGGLKGGRARANKLSPEERREIAKKAAKARWHEQDNGD